MALHAFKDKGQREFMRVTGADVLRSQCGLVDASNKHVPTAPSYNPERLAIDCGRNLGITATAEITQALPLPVALEQLLAVELQIIRYPVVLRRLPEDRFKPQAQLP